MPYTPEQLDRIVSRVVDRVVDRVEPVVPYSARTLTVDCRRLLEWSVRREPEAPFHPVRVFSEQNITEFVRSRSSSLKDSSRSNLRSRLRRVAEVMAPPRLPAEVERFEPADPRQPYTTKRELDRLDRWAEAQGTRADEAKTLLALGLGAGLSSLEIRNLRGRDILVDKLGVQVRVEEGRARKVQVLARWEQQLADRKKQIKSGEYVIAPGRTKPIKNLVTNFVARGAMDKSGPTTQRMRATWLVTHMQAGTNVRVLLEAAGLDSLEALTRYVAFVVPGKVADRRAALRGDESSADAAQAGAPISSNEWKDGRAG